MAKKKVLKIVSAPVIKKKKKLKVVKTLPAPVIKKKRKLKLTDGVYDELRGIVITNDNWEF